VTDTAYKPGTIIGFDLTVPEAETLRDFYASVVGWKPAPLSLGDYDDYFMETADGQVVAGVCHARGENADLPPQWLAYIIVPDQDESLRRSAASGGTQVSAIRGGGSDPRFAVIRGPAGAHLALMQMAAPADQ
jgi:predicted enzyme related to lactoylglutathione lyase